MNSSAVSNSLSLPELEKKADALRELSGDQVLSFAKFTKSQTNSDSYVDLALNAGIHSLINSIPVGLAAISTALAEGSASELAKYKAFFGGALLASTAYSCFQVGQTAWELEKKEPIAQYNSYLNDCIKNYAAPECTDIAKSGHRSLDSGIARLTNEAPLTIEQFFQESTNPQSLLFSPVPSSENHEKSYISHIAAVGTASALHFGASHLASINRPNNAWLPYGVFLAANTIGWVTPKPDLALLDKGTSITGHRYERYLDKFLIEHAEQSSQGVSR